MSAEQIDLFDILFPTPKDSICKNLKEAVKNECGVFIEQNVMFKGGSYGEGERVVITIARKSPFIYYSFSCETRIQGRSHPCSDECLHKNISEEDYLEMHDGGEGDSFWTEWDDDDGFENSHAFEQRK